MNFGNNHYGYQDYGNHDNQDHNDDEISAIINSDEDSNIENIINSDDDDINAIINSDENDNIENIINADDNEKIENIINSEEDDIENILNEEKSGETEEEKEKPKKVAKKAQKKPAVKTYREKEVFEAIEVATKLMKLEDKPKILSTIYSLYGIHPQTRIPKASLNIIEGDSDDLSSYVDMITDVRNKIVQGETMSFEDGIRLSATFSDMDPKEKTALFKMLDEVNESDKKIRWNRKKSDFDTVNLFVEAVKSSGDSIDDLTEVLKDLSR